MRELKVVGLDADGKNIICQGAIPSEQFKLPVDDRLRAALRDDSVQPEQAQLDIEVTNVLSPKEIQARIRAGASVEQVAAASGSDIARIRRFAHPVLLERSRAAELATAAHPVLADGPAVLTMQETVAAALVARGLNPTASPGTRGATRTVAGRCSLPGRLAAPTTWRISASPPAPTAEPPPRSTTRPMS